MSDDSLSKNQVTNLLKAMRSDNERGDNERGDNERGDDDAELPTPAGIEAPSEKVADYDFRHASPVCRDQLNNLHAMHEAVAASFATSMSKVLRTSVDVILEGVEQKTCGDVIHSMADPGCLCEIAALSQGSKTSDCWMAEVQPKLVFALIDRLLGGEPNPGESIQREMTEIEVRLIRRVANELANQLQLVWSKVNPGTLVVEDINSHPHRKVISSVNEQVVCVEFSMSFCNVRDSITLAIPWLSLIHI